MVTIKSIKTTLNNVQRKIDDQEILIKTPMNINFIFMKGKSGLRIACCIKWASNIRKYLVQWMGGWVDGWVEGKAGLRIAYSNQK